MAWLTEPEFGELLSSFERSAFRFETRDSYNSDVGRVPYQLFRDGEPDDYRWHEPWLAKVRADRQRGRSWRRVRIVSVPLADWTRYGMQVARLSIAAGEDIRYLRRNVATDHGLRPLDAWLLDDERLIHLHFDDRDDRFMGAEPVESAEVVEQHRHWRDLAWTLALPLDGFLATVQ